LKCSSIKIISANNREVICRHNEEWKRRQKHMCTKPMGGDITLFVSKFEWSIKTNYQKHTKQFIKTDSKTSYEHSSALISIPCCVTSYAKSYWLRDICPLSFVALVSRHSLSRCFRFRISREVLSSCQLGLLEPQLPHLGKDQF
jgi:hypothetical protein